ncbi:helix-turn-helix domain-containing protein [Nocardiopsis valliformis]|uniref:helix-turn-helix domain-containing protein n=1 Tax=Nocardiopsis valliformis TaxID=239974 RepID=UPI00034D3397|nr:helix-turn-helix transcriptional regulator [Nocardiopsis valliformis]
MARGAGLPLDGARLRKARQAAGLSQRVLAERLTTTRQQVIRYEQGQERPEVKRLALLAAAVGVGVADLVEPESLPDGLAGLRVGAGLTLAAAAESVRGQLPAGIACSRPVLAGAERGEQPPTWVPLEAAGAVRSALGSAYGAGQEAVVAAWEATFGTVAAPPPEHQDGSDRTPDREVSQTTPPLPDAEEDHAPRAVSEKPAQEEPGLPLDGAPEESAPPPVKEVSVRVRGQADPNGRVFCLLYTDTATIGHLEDRHHWDQREGWTLHGLLSEEERERLTPQEQLAPDAVTSETDMAAALPELLSTLFGRPVSVVSLHGERTDLPIRPADMERWELRRGRVTGRDDIYVRSRCWGWFQRAGDGITVHTADGPVPGGPWPTREEAASALWAHLTAPLPPPQLTKSAWTKRRMRGRPKQRPLCPYTPAELARVRLVETPDSARRTRQYQAQGPDDQVIGFVWKRQHVPAPRSWAYCAADASGEPVNTAAASAVGTRAEAVERLLAQPGPVWADPAEAIVH